MGVENIIEDAVGEGEVIPGSEDIDQLGFRPSFFPCPGPRIYDVHIRIRPLLRSQTEITPRRAYFYAASPMQVLFDQLAYQLSISFLQSFTGWDGLLANETWGRLYTYSSCRDTVRFSRSWRLTGTSGFRRVTYLEQEGSDSRLQSG